MRLAVIKPSHGGMSREYAEYGIEFQQIFLSLSGAKRLEGISIDFLQIPFGALR